MSELENVKLRKLEAALPSSGSAVPRVETRTACLHQLFESRVAQTPRAVALRFEGASLSYGELNRRANQLAHALLELGVGPEVLVGLCTRRSPELIVGLLGILKTGGAYVPLDPSHPWDHLRFIIEDSEIAVIVTDGPSASAVESARAHRLSLDPDALVRHPADDPQPRATPENLAYVIYTSGSTGRPKGVLVEHRNVVRLFTSTQPWFRFDARDVWTLFHSYGFDFSIWEIWGALLYGGRLVVVPYAVSREPHAFRELMCDEGVTVLNQTPSAFRQLIRADASAQARDGLALRVVVLGGEALDPEMLEPWFERHGDRSPRLVNMYGITETTVHVSYHPLRRGEAPVARGSPIGNPLPDLEIHLLDPKGDAVPVGAPGEIYVGGAGVARGYLKRPSLTRDRFRTDFLSATPAERLYRSGDLAIRLPDGSFSYLGRIDDQLKIRGFRIEPAEVEARLREHPEVADAAVVARDYGPGDRRLLAWIVPRSSTTQSEDLAPSLIDFARRRIPVEMQPAAFRQIPSIPLTVHGKIDWQRLLASEPASPTSHQPGPHEAGLLEHLTQLWKQLLESDQLGPDDDFFDLGGDSLLLVVMFGQIEERFGVRLAPAVLAEGATLRRLAAAITAHSSS